MTYKEVDSYIEHMDENELVTLCNDIYDWMYISGVLEPESVLVQLSVKLKFEDRRYLADQIIRESAKRFNKTVLLLLRNQPHDFLRKHDN